MRVLITENLAIIGRLYKGICQNTCQERITSDDKGLLVSLHNSDNLLVHRSRVCRDLCLEFTKRHCIGNNSGISLTDDL